MDEKDKKKQFEDLIKQIPEYLKEKEKEDLFFTAESEDGTFFVVHLWDNDYFFSMESQNEFMNLWHNKILTPNKGGYICVKDKDNGELIGIHRFLKRKDVERMAEELKCDIMDIEVNHRDGDKFNNELSNLQVVHIDTHAQIHGFRDGERLRAWREKQKDREFS